MNGHVEFERIASATSRCIYSTAKVELRGAFDRQGKQLELMQCQ